MDNNTAILQKEYLTTTEFATLCGVSRFTIINWIKQGKVKCINTAGRHRRISLPETINFLETLSAGDQQDGRPSDLFGCCWEFVADQNRKKKCRNCLIYKKRIDCCFLLVRRFGKERLRCKDDCLNCGYFIKIFGERDKKTTKKKDFLNNVSYGLGCRVRGLKEGFKNLKRKVSRE